MSKSGFKTAVRSGLNVHVTDIEQATVQLEVGDVTQTIVVSGQGELLNTQDTALGHVTNQQTVEGLPLVNRNYPTPFTATCLSLFATISLMRTTFS